MTQAAPFRTHEVDLFVKYPEKIVFARDAGSMPTTNVGYLGRWTVEARNRREAGQIAKRLYRNDRTAPIENPVQDLFDKMRMEVGKPERIPFSAEGSFTMTAKLGGDITFAHDSVEGGYTASEGKRLGPTQRKIYEHIFNSHPDGATRQEIMDAQGLTNDSARKSIKRLMDDGLITEEAGIYYLNTKPQQS